MKYVIPTSQAEHCVENLIGREGIEVIFPDKNNEKSRYFPDGEVYTRISRIDELKGNEVTLVHSGMPKDGFIELFNYLNILKRPRVKSLDVFFTYFGYGGQDREFKTGETNTVKNILSLLAARPYNAFIYTIDAHFAKRNWLHNFPFRNFSAFEVLMEEVKKDYPNIEPIAPDAGSSRRTGLEGLIKKRIDSNTVEFLEMPPKIKKRITGKDIAIVDDMIRTGTTMRDAFDICKEIGKDVVAVSTHGVIPSGVKKIENKFDKLYLGNTIDGVGANVDVVTPLISKIL